MNNKLIIFVVFFFQISCAMFANEDGNFAKVLSYANNKDEIRGCFPKKNIRETEFVTDNGNLFFVTVPVGSGFVRDNVYGYYEYRDGNYVLFIYFVANATGTSFIYDSNAKTVKLISFDKQVLLILPPFPIFKYNATRAVTDRDIQQRKKVDFDIKDSSIQK